MTSENCKFQNKPFRTKTELFAKSRAGHAIDVIMLLILVVYYSPPIRANQEVKPKRKNLGAKNNIQSYVD